MYLFLRIEITQYTQKNRRTCAWIMTPARQQCITYRYSATFCCGNAVVLYAVACKICSNNNKRQQICRKQAIIFFLKSTLSGPSTTLSCSKEDERGNFLTLHVPPTRLCGSFMFVLFCLLKLCHCRSCGFNLYSDLTLRTEFYFIAFNVFTYSWILNYYQLFPPIAPITLTKIFLFLSLSSSTSRIVFRCDFIKLSLLILILILILHAWHM